MNVQQYLTSTLPHTEKGRQNTTFSIITSCLRACVLTLLNLVEQEEKQNVGALRNSSWLCSI
jgi:hypothetical protein